MHSFWTPTWFIKFGIAIVGGFYVGATRSTWLGLGFFVAAIIVITALAQIVYGLLRTLAPSVVRRWELDDAKRVLGIDEPDRM